MIFLKRCWQRRWIRGLLWTAVTLVTAFALLSTWVNWSGARQWRATQAMLKAEGETIDFRATLNEPVPEAENFCAIPLLKDLALDPNNGGPSEQRARLNALRLPSAGNGAARPGIANASLGNRTDLKAWADWLRMEGSLAVPADSGDAGRHVLAALATHDAIMQELTAGLTRPHAQWTPEWKSRELPDLLFAITMPHYASVMSGNHTLALRAAAAARTGDATKAHETALILARLSQANLNDPFLISLLVAAAGTGTLGGVTWELCDAHAGTANDFTKLEMALTSLDFHRATLHAWRSEMAAGVNSLQFLKRKPEDALGAFLLTDGLGGKPAGKALGNAAMRGMPSGFFDASSAVLADREFKYLVKPLRDHGWQAARKASQDCEAELIAMKAQIWTHPSYIVTSLMIPTIKTIVGKSIYTQTLVNQAAIACALERYRIEKGAYPDSLDAIKLADGKPLPLDAINGQPMGYRKTTGGRYALWSVGFDGKDDGGKRVLDAEKPESTKFNDEKYVGDWVWDFPAH